MIETYVAARLRRLLLPVVTLVVLLGLAFAATSTGGATLVAVASAPGAAAGGGGCSVDVRGLAGAALARAAAAAAGSDWDVNVAVAVSGAETGGTYNPLARNPASSASGLWQVMLSAHPDKIAAFGDWRNPLANARMAHAIWLEAKQAGRDPWSPWVTYTNGAYRRYLQPLGIPTPTCQPATPAQPVDVAGDGKGRSDNVPCTVGAPGRVDTAPGGVPIRVCPVGALEVNARAAGNAAAMIAAARAAGLDIGGSAFRSTARQIELRRAHCGSSHHAIYDAPSRSCSPPTAPPGRSMHEWGLALDLTCNGPTIGSHGSPCFVWLAANAARYGFHNLSSEPWHWSTNAR